MKNSHIFELISVILLIVGGLNWGLVGLFNFDLVQTILGTVIARIIYVLVGIAAVYRVVVWARSRTK